MDLGAIKKMVVETCGLDEFIFEDALRDEVNGPPYHRFYATKVLGARTYYIYGAWTQYAMDYAMSDLIQYLKYAFDEAEKQETGVS